MKSCVDPVADGKRAASEVKAAIHRLIEEGTPATVHEVLLTLARELDLDVSRFSEVEALAQQTLLRHRECCGLQLRTAAAEAKCSFSYNPPHIQFGCVHLFESKPGLWSISVLDDVPVQLVATHSGRILAETALKQIAAVESTLKALERHRKSVLRSVEACQQLFGRSKDLPINLVMLLTGLGGNAKQLLANPIQPTAADGLSRAQFGFVITAMLSRPRDGARAAEMSVGGATQVSTTSADRFLAIPETQDPRQPGNRRLVATVSIME
jgi:hypothetical protein